MMFCDKMQTMEEKEQNVLNQTENQEVVSAGSDVEMIEVNTPNFFGRHFLHLLAVFGVGFLMFIFTFEIYFTPIYIIGASMQPTINQNASYNDLVYYRAKESYATGDIVIVDSKNYLPELGSSIIKRVVAKSGQTITFKIYKIAITESNPFGEAMVHAYYTLLLDGKQLSENYIKEQECYLQFKIIWATKTYASSEYYTLLRDTIYPAMLDQTGGVWALATESNPVVANVAIQENQYFVCGDNRNNSTDSRYFGAVTYSDILGNVRIHVPHGTNLFVALWRAIFA